MAFNKADVIANAQKFGPKQKGKISLFANQNRVTKDVTGKDVIDPKKPSLFGYMTDSDMNMFSLTIWKNKDAKKNKDGSIMKDKDGNTVYKITFKGNAESLGVKQNVVDIKPSGQEKDSLDDILS
tara:strand:- start:30 stop:404 length:375 start_codon:yes stop_codon:yes gene_type:complete